MIETGRSNQVGIPRRSGIDRRKVGRLVQAMKTQGFKAFDQGLKHPNSKVGFDPKIIEAAYAIAQQEKEDMIALGITHDRRNYRKCAGLVGPFAPTVFLDRRELNSSFGVGVKAPSTTDSTSINEAF